MGIVESSVAVILLGQVATASDPAVERLKYMQTTGASYTVTTEDRRGVSFREEPLLRWTNPVSGVPDGGLFIWEDDSKRPLAAAQIFLAPGTEDLWIHEFQSLATEPLRFEYEGRAAWTPRDAGVMFDPLEEAPSPSASASGRLIQMRQLARRFSVKDDFEGASVDELRLMATPLARYADTSATDGAVFAFTHGTDPELFVMLEARPTADGEPLVWHRALAPMTAYAITVNFDGIEDWTVPWRKAPQPITATFKNFPFPPAPEPSLLQRLFDR